MEIPEKVREILELEDEDEVEFLNPYGNLVLFVKKVSDLDPKKLNVLKKVNSLKYWNRTLDNIRNVLTKEEFDLFSKMLEEKIFFKYVKDKKELIGISKEYFKFILPESGGDEISVLKRKKYLCFSDEKKAEELNKKIKELALDSEVVGVRSFDKKYYIVFKDFLKKYRPKLEQILKTPKTLAEIVKETGLNEEACKALLEVLKEEGLFIEKKKGVYVRA